MTPLDGMITGSKPSLIKQVADARKRCQELDTVDGPFNIYPLAMQIRTIMMAIVSGLQTPKEPGPIYDALVMLDNLHWQLPEVIQYRKSGCLFDDLKLPVGLRPGPSEN